VGDRSNPEWVERFESGESKPFDWEVLYRVARADCFDRLPFQIPPPTSVTRNQVVREKLLAKIFYVGWRCLLGTLKLCRFWIRAGWVGAYGDRTRSMIYQTMQQWTIEITQILALFPELIVDNFLKELENMLKYPGMLEFEGAPGVPRPG